MLESLTSYVAALSPGWFYFVLVVSAFVENVVPPIPGDTVTVFAAYVVGRSRRGILGVFLATTLGSAAGFMSLYVLGRLIQREYFIRRDFRLLRASSFLAAERWFQRHGYWIVVANRFFAGFRSVVSIVCGVYRLPWVHVLVLSCLGCAVWNLMLIWAGYLLGANWMAVDRALGQYSRIVIAIMVLGAGLWLFGRRRPPARSPASGHGKSEGQGEDGRLG
ncbi:MAG: DedA family protein [Acidobacteria bacterium]|nr:DedA family protein [Acidobacteriota bacterium]